MGSLIGLYVGMIGIGPHTVPDCVFYAGIVLALLWGLVVATRGKDGVTHLTFRVERPAPVRNLR